MPNILIKTVKMLTIFIGCIIDKTPTFAVVKEIKEKLDEINAIHSIEKNKMAFLTKCALESRKETDLKELSESSLLFDDFYKFCNEQNIILVQIMQGIEDKLRPSQNTRSKSDLSLNSISVAPVAPVSKPAVSVPISPKQITFHDLKIKFSLLIINLIEYYTSEIYPVVNFTLATETVVVMGNPICINTSDVRGDGACGFRAILTSYLLRVGKHLPYNPFGLPDFILQLKYCMYDLLYILNQNSENHNFINNLLSNPANGSKKANIDEWFEMINNNDYNCTDGDMRIISILFGMLSVQDRITQINVLKLRPVEHNPYQSFSCYGTNNIVPVCSESHINIIHTGGHYRAVVEFTGNLLPIYSIDAEIIIPSA